MAKPYGLASQKLCYIQMLLNIENSGEQEEERSLEWLVNKGPCSAYFSTYRSFDAAFQFGNLGEKDQDCS